jgi:hypothetical protein
MTNLLSELENDVGPLPSKVRAKPINGNSVHSGESSFALVNEIPVLEVLDWLHIKYKQHGERIYAECPECGNGLERSDVVILGNIHKCSHQGCENAGPSSSPGTRTCVDLTMLAHNVDKLTAVKMLAERFGIQLPKSKADRDDDIDDSSPEANAAAGWTATVDMPDSQYRGGGQKGTTLTNRQRRSLEPLPILLPTGRKKANRSA